MATSSSRAFVSNESELAKSFNEDVVERHAKHFLGLIAAHIGSRDAPVRALDLMCGTGYATVPLLEKLPPGSSVVALSDDRFSLKQFHQVLTADHRQQIFPRKETLERLPFADETFDLIWGAYPTRMVGNLETLLRHAVRILRPGGQLMLCVPLQGSFLALRQAFGAQETTSMQRMIAEATQLQTSDAWAQLLESVGLTQVEVDISSHTLEAVPPLSKDRLLARHLVPLWLGGVPSPTTDATLDAVVTDAIQIEVHLGCVAGRRAPS